MEGIIINIIVNIKLQQSSIWSLNTAPYKALRELYREPLVELLAEPLAKSLTKPLTQFLTRFWRVLYLTKSLLIYNNSSSKLDSTINFPSYRFCKKPAKGFAKSST